MRSIDTLIDAGWIIPVEPADTIYERHSLAIDDGKIIDILPSNAAVGKYAPRLTHRLASHVLIPGLVNTHTHAAMSLLRGFADDLPLQEWLETRIWPAEHACVNHEFVADGTRLAIAEMLRSGVTCFNDMYFFPDATAEVVNQAAMRATIGLILIDFPTPWAETPQAYLDKGAAVHAQYLGHPLINTALAPHAPYTVSDNSLVAARELAEQFDIPMHIHVHETASEVRYAEETQGLRPLARLEKLGLLDQRLLAVHMTQLTDSEIQHIAETKVNVVHCPESNLKLASGFCPTHDLLQAGVNVALGTDGTASNDDLDILGEMRTAALLGKGVSQDARALPAATVLRMATLNGAQALGIGHIVGSLEMGKAADVVAIDLQDVETLPVYNPLAQLVYAVGRDKVTDVWVAGKRLLRDRALTTLDIHDVRARTHVWRDKVLNSVAKA